LILIATNKQDSHTDEVVRKLNTRQVPVFRFNTEDLLTKYRVTLTLGADGKWAGHLTDEVERVLDLAAVKVGWLRKPRFDFDTAGIDQAYREFVVAESRALIDTIYSLPNIVWINDPFVANKSKVKFQQLLLARRFGVSTPKTLVTTDPRQALEFFRSCEAVVAKAVYSGNVTMDGVNRGIPTVAIDEASFLEHLEQIRYAPTQLQERVPKAFELRITVVGDQAFAVRIDSQVSEKTKVDWRLATDTIPHLRFDLPNNVECFCIEFLKAQGLSFGAMDFVVTP